ncbi:zinc finger C3H domain-containing protein [Vairimorpha necatrix]|uniref:Zinc finger C3H domain-containing protein n=1 Tax=Vairimorpha necatrix TaxID=6039 RepID=A0AAX4JGF8_9MICR
MAKKQVQTTKDIKAQIKEIEEKMFGLKNKKQKSALEKQIEALRIKDSELKQSKVKKEVRPVVQKIPVGVDPKTVQCVNYLNKVCNDGENCRFAHENIKKIESKNTEVDKTKTKHVCRFLLDAINNNEFNNNWKCPFPKCNDIHKLIDLKGDTTAELSLEEYLELSRQSLGDNLTPLTEERFIEWKEKKLKEELEHQKKLQALSSGPKGLELFESRPEIFLDDEEAVDVDYKERCYSEEEEEDAPIYN